jgi:anti-sigma factor RsiW
MSDYSEHDAPTPQLLAAFLDGELDRRTAARVAGWLDRHPEAAAELDAEHCLERLWASSPLPEPNQAEWSAVRKRIETALPPSAHRLRRHTRWAGLAGAAAVLLALLLHRPTGKEQPLPHPLAEPAVTPFAVVADNDVEILSMDAADTEALVVGELPMHGPVVLAGPGDVILDSLLPDDGLETPMQMGMGGTTDNGDGPMIVVRVAQADR